MKAMANCFLGYQEHFNIDMETYRTPFGIKDAQPSYSKKGYKTTITPIIQNTNKAKIYIRHSKLGLQFEFIGSLFDVPRVLPKDVQKMRIDTLFFDFIHSPYGNEISIESKDIFNKNIKAKFKELYYYFCILNNLQKSSSLYIQIKAPNGNMSPEITLSVSEVQLFDNFSNIFTSIESTYKKASVLNCDEELISTNYMWQHLNHFNFFNIIDKKYNPNYIFEFEGENNNNIEADVVIFSSTIKFDNKTLLFISAFYGSFEKVHKNIFRGQFHESKLLGEYVLDSTNDLQNITKEKLEKHQKEVSEFGLHIF